MEEEVEKILQTYDLTEIIELNDKTEEEVLYFLLRHRFLDLPEPRPIDL
jgi:hypothetical protein